MFFQKSKGMIIKNEIDYRILSDHCCTAWRRNCVLKIKFLKIHLNLAYSYGSKDECEKKLVLFKGKNKISAVDTFYSKSAKIVTDHEPLSDNKRVVVNAFQCMQVN